MTTKRPYSVLIDQLKDAGLRPTRQRLALAKLLFEGGNRHFTAEQLHADAMNAEVRVSLATVYNTLHQFNDAGLLREVVVEAGRSYFDTNMDDHHHFYIEGSGELRDVDRDEVVLSALPKAPEGMKVSRVDVVIRLDDSDAS